MTFRILSLDGGGPWALIQVRALMALDGNSARTTGHQILRAFDLVVANSGGSIVLGGLLEDRPLGELIQFFKNEAMRKTIFSPTKSIRARLARYFLCLGPLYSTDAKFAALQKLMEKHGRDPLSTAAASVRRENGETKLLIVSFDYDRNRARLFRSYASGPSSSRYAKTSVAEAIHASTNAPVNYFDKPAEFPDRSGRYWDGAMTGCNNPVLIGVTEAIAMGQKPADIVALSLGTGTVVRPWQQPGEDSSPYFQTPGKSGLLNDAKKAAGAILDDPPDMATYVAHYMTGGSDDVPQSRIVRMNPLVSPVKAPDGAWKAPGTMTLEEFNCFADIDMDAQEQREIEAIDRYATLWTQDKVYNQPIKMNGDNLACECGDRWFSDALRSWIAVRGP